MNYLNELSSKPKRIRRTFPRLTGSLPVLKGKAASKWSKWWHVYKIPHHAESKRARTENLASPEPPAEVDTDILAIILRELNAIKDIQISIISAQQNLSNQQRTLSNQIQILQNRDKKFYTRLQDLPFETMVQIFAWIPAQTVFKYRRLSKTINGVLLSSQFAVLNMYMPDFQDGSNDSIRGLCFVLPPPYQIAVARALGSQVKRVVRFDFREFKKSLPESINCLTAVEEMSLCYFKIWNLQALRILEMDSSNMFGSLAGVGALRNLWSLDVFNNQLCGTLPSREISSMLTLRSLHLSKNQFSGHDKVTNRPDDSDSDSNSDSNSQFESKSELDASESAGSESETDSMED
ncbi:hypothetical protein BJ741DRAFT_654324 [Chytriomyces cf. hyalinus JEL632]|nr:hypothetical protein BJ741DRAFT_654324 [Chytriomyces cf. hyalinus JEL632]